MKVVIFGSTGRIGKYLIQYALEAGYDVTAFTRNPSSLTIRHPRLGIFQGDATNPGAVDNVMRGKEAVLSAIGTGLGQSNIHYTCMRNIVEAMAAHGAKRIVCIGGMEILQANENTQIFETEGFPADRLLLSKEHNASFELLANSGASYTIACPLSIIDGPKTEMVATEANYPPKGNLQVTTGDLAWFMVKELADNQYVRSRVGITNL